MKASIRSRAARSGSSSAATAAAASSAKSPFVFYPRYAAEIAVKAGKYLGFFLMTRRLLKQALDATDRWSYSDVAIEPPRDDEFEQLALYHATTGGEAALARMRLGDSIRGGAVARAPAAASAAAE